jgi:hypothetical protein
MLRENAVQDDKNFSPNSVVYFEVLHTNAATFKHFIPGEFAHATTGHRESTACG